ncbi:hypothetical protein ACWC0A_02110 [Streptomyces scopuliridis]
MTSRTSSAERPERARPAPHGLTGVGVAVLDEAGLVLPGLGHDGRRELPGGGRGLPGTHRQQPNRRHPVGQVHTWNHIARTRLLLAVRFGDHQIAHRITIVHHHPVPGSAGPYRLPGRSRACM